MGIYHCWKEASALTARVIPMQQKAGTLLLVVASMSMAQQPPAKPGTAGNIVAPVTPRAIVDRYCVTCHSQNRKTAGLLLDRLDFSHIRENAAMLEKIARKVRAGMMPPANAPRLDWTTRLALVTSLENELDRNAVRNLPEPGIHRLNRMEYANAIRDLLALEVDPTKFLPPDDSTRGFDNIAGALSFSPALIEAYISAAGKISRLAIGDAAAPNQTVYSAPDDTAQEQRVAGLPFGTRGGILFHHQFPADGEYVFRVVSIRRRGVGEAFGDIGGEQLLILVDNQEVGRFDWDKAMNRRESLTVEPALELKVPVKAGPHEVGVTFLATNFAPINDHNKHFPRPTIMTGGIPGFTFYPHIGRVRITGPLNGDGAADTPSRRKIFVCHPAGPERQVSCAKQIIATLARHAFRRPVTDADVELLMDYYQQGRNSGDFESGIEMAVRCILASPDFIFRKEGEPADAAPGKPYRISDLELASRLSFFFWSSIPDEELIRVASQGKLRDPDELELQVRRMLADPRSEAFVTNFTGQWLNLRGLDTHHPVALQFPAFDDNLRQAFRRETELFFDSIIREDRSILDLLSADYTFVNERLAKHYGIPNVSGDQFRRVTLGPEFDVRRGLLGKGALLMVSSQPGRTSPVQRGKWFLQTFLGVSPPDPPPNVPPLKPKEDIAGGNGKQPSMRQQMEAHRQNPVCAACHTIMDPIGFSLENFDGIGMWRTQDGGEPINAAGQLVDGTPLNGPASLREALVRYSDQCVRVFTERLLTYALGRGVEYYDMPVIRSIDREAGRSNYRFVSLVMSVVKSEPFQMNMKPLEQRAAR